MIKKILHIGLLLFAMFGIQGLSTESQFHTTLTLTNDFQLNIKETEDYSLTLTLSQANKIKETLTMENANTKMKLIQKEKLCGTCEYIYFITAYDRSSTYGSQTNIIVWQSNQSWKMLKTPLEQGFLEKDSNGKYEIVEYYPKKKTYSFQEGKLIEVKSQ